MRIAWIVIAVVALAASTVLAGGSIAEPSVLSVRGDATIQHGFCSHGHTSLYVRNYSGVEVALCFTDSVGIFQIENLEGVVTVGNWAKVYSAYLEWLINAGGYQQYTVVARKDGDCLMVLCLLGTYER